ncbi:hypothetical protein [Actinoplanes sp. NPDC026619]|uniref:hypothetical protein n=1 Tax=Actinoplanes sp. NPDC026619 TaxID=3155798 RepID=UPI0033ED32AB
MRLRIPQSPAAWSAATLVLGQLALMATSLVFSLSLAYGGGLSAVGSTASAVLIFQLTVGVLQRSLAEATLLAESHAGHKTDYKTCQWAVGASLTGGVIGALVAIVAALVVPDVDAGLAIAYAAGIPFAIVLDIGRSAGVAAGSPRGAFVETAAWLATQMVAMLTFAALHSPLGICLSWAVVNAGFFLLAAAAYAHRRAAFRGLGQWLGSRRGLLGPATFDAFLVGVTPLLAIQITAFFVSPAVLGAVRILQQVYAPLAFVSITLRRVLVYRRKADAAAGALSDLRDGLVSTALMAVGAVIIGFAIIGGRELVPALSFIPVGVALIAAGIEKAALGLSFGTSLSRFVRGEFSALLQTRYVMLVVTLIAAPLMAARWDAVGYLLGSSLGMVIYSIAVILWPQSSRTSGPRQPTPAEPATR